MHIGYFTHSPVSISETFIHDLIYALDARASKLTFFSGAASTRDLPGITTLPTGYHEIPEAKSYRLYKVGQVFGRRGDLLRFNYAQTAAQRILRTHIDAVSQLDVAFLDYGTSAALLAPFLRSMGIPYVLQVHAFDVTCAFASERYKSAFLEASAHSQGIIVVSEHMRRLLVLAGVDPRLIHTVRLGISPDAITPMPWDQRRQQPPTVIHLGRLTEKKHPIALVHAFALVHRAIPNARLEIIGDGPLRAEVEHRIRSLGIADAVTLHGALGREHSFPIMNRGQVFAQHSVTSISGDQEGFPVSPAEAAMFELPVVTTAHSGLTENIVDGETGFLVQEHNYEAMAERIIHLLQHPEVAEQMGKAGRRRILAMCRPEERADRIFALLDAAAQTRRSGAPLALTTV
ncbi:MAG: glycosyltransferase [Rhodothermales bacterium]|nr:glycosyltransferase [Rhodothermales bacterium]